MTAVPPLVARSPWKARRLSPKALLLTAALVVPSWATLPAGAAELWPLTKVRVTVVQWNPIKGLYERWDALNGEYMVAGDGSMLLPVIGLMQTSDLSNDQIAVDIAGALRDRLGLVQVPETTVEVISYPPIYVVGDVKAPGAFDYLPGMTVLQAFALSGGPPTEATGIAEERLRLGADLRMLTDNLLRVRARLARLAAESAGAETIAFPQEVIGHPDAEMAKAAMAEEKAILEARARQARRQAESLDELVALLNLEIETLNTRIGDIERNVASAEEDLANAQSLADKGLITASRRSDLERIVTDLRFDGLTQRTAIIRAQQALSEARREAARLEDERRTQLALDIQNEQAKLQQVLLDQATAQNLLVNLAEGPATGGSVQLSYSIVRQGAEGPVELAGTEMTAMVPGDVLKVTSARGIASVASSETASTAP